MDLERAQGDFRKAHADGAPGVFVSALVWLAAGYVWQVAGLERAFLVLFFGGMAIHPLATALARLALRRPAHDPANPLARLALESTLALIVGIVIAWVLLMRQPELAIPAFAAIMGARFMVFRTLYGRAFYWLLGGAIALLGCAALFARTVPVGNLAWQVGLIELVGAALLVLRQRGSAP